MTKPTQTEYDIAWTIFHAVDGSSDRKTFEREVRRISHAPARFSGVTAACLIATRNIIVEHVKP